MLPSQNTANGCIFLLKLFFEEIKLTNDMLSLKINNLVGPDNKFIKMLFLVSFFNKLVFI